MALAVVLVSALCGPAPVHAALSCEQLYVVLQATVRYRDQGYTLTQVLSALDNIQAEHKLTGAEVAALRNAVSATYLGHTSPEEVALECVSARGAKK